MDANPEHMLNRLLAAFNDNDVVGLPLGDDVHYGGPLVTRPVRGAAAVREHLATIAPFVARMTLRHSVADDSSVAAEFEFAGVNGVIVEGAVFLHGGDGLIREIRVYFDAGPLLRGRA